jgi:MATE family multidrug resistance protein
LNQSLKPHIKSTLLLAYPVAIGYVGYIAMQVVDNIMIGGLGAVYLAAASVANSIFIIIMIAGLGISYAVTPLVAIAIGAGKTSECEKLFKHSIIVNLTAAIILVVITLLSSNIIHYLNQPPEIVDKAISYCRILGLSILPLMLFQCYKQFMEGLSSTRPAMIITVLANLINAFFNWILVYGRYGFPKLELNGSGLATFFSRLFMALAILWYFRHSREFNCYSFTLKIKELSFHFIKKILNIGLPTAFQYIFEVGSFSAAVIMIGWLGTKQLAAHQIAINLASITYMAALGISSSGAIRVGNAVGHQDIAEVRKAGFIAIILGASMMFFCAIVLITLRNYLPLLYIKDKEVISIASVLLIIAAFFQIFDGTQAVGIGVLRGLTDVKGPTIITFIAYWIIEIPVAYILGFVFHIGVIGVWLGFLTGLFFSAFMLTLRFNKKSRQLVNMYPLDQLH